MRHKYVVTVSGCDDSTEVVLGLTPARAALLVDVAEAITEASDGACMPTMHVERIIWSSRD